MSDDRLKLQLRAVQMTTIGMAQLLIYANERIEELENELAALKKEFTKQNETPDNGH